MEREGASVRLCSVTSVYSQPNRIHFHLPISQSTNQPISLSVIQPINCPPCLFVRTPLPPLFRTLTRSFTRSLTRSYAHTLTRSPRFCLSHIILTLAHYCHISRTSLSTLSIVLTTLPHFHTSTLPHFHRPSSTFYLPPSTFHLRLSYPTGIRI